MRASQNKFLTKGKITIKGRNFHNKYSSIILGLDNMIKQPQKDLFQTKVIDQIDDVLLYPNPFSESAQLSYYLEYDQACFH